MSRRFFIDHATGTLSAVSGSPFGAGAGPLSIAIDPTDAFAYVANQAAASIAEYSLDATTGVLSAPSGSPLGVVPIPESLTVDPLGSFVVRGKCRCREPRGQLFHHARDRCTALSIAGAGRFPADRHRDRSHRANFVYAVNYNSNDISGVHRRAAGVLTLVSGSPFAVGIQPHAIAID